MYIYSNANIYLILVSLIKHIETVTYIEDEYSNDSLQISTDKGIIQGKKVITYNDTIYWAYVGIPYAKPPVGSLRFRAPKPAEPWPGVLDATKEGPACVETFLISASVTVGGNEDCLYLNVFTPQDPKAVKEHLPVIVWLYGGAFIEGNSSQEYYGPDNLLEQNVIVITFNYRVGMFGFLSTGDTASPGNYGLKDQNLVLRWIQRNIEKFGGDRTRVTIAGHSSGAASVFYHIASLKSRGLFHRAIANSGSTLCLFAYKRDARDVAFQIGAGIGVTTKNTKELISKLRKVDVNKLKEISVSLVTLSLFMSTVQGFPFNPVIEPNHKDAFISESTYTLMENGNFNRVPVLLGINTLEAIFFIKLINTLRPVSALFDISPGLLPNPSMNIKSFEERRKVGILIKRHYFEGECFSGSTDEEVLNYISDDQFVRPIRKTIQLISKYVPTYFYLFAYLSDYGFKGKEDDLKGGDGVSHTEELTYIWKGAGRSAPKGFDKLIVLRMAKWWYNFARTGNPTPVEDVLFENIIWPRVDSPKRISYLKIDVNMSIGENYREEHMRFWDKLYEKYGVEPYVTF